MEYIARVVSNVVWPMFIPFLLLLGTYICLQVFFNIRQRITTKGKINYKYIIPQSTVALGTMMGTGTVVGFLTGLSKLSISGQIYVESIAIWALLGSIILIPISYCETLISKVVRMQPKEYIKVFISTKASKLYVASLVLLYIFAIGGIQLSGIDAVATTSINKIVSLEFNELQRYMYIVIPVIIILITIILKNRQSIFLRILVTMVILSFSTYLLSFFIFLYKTQEYIPIFVERIIIGFKNPVSVLFGIPLGLIFGLQRVIQIAEPGLGTLALASMKSNAKPREAALISSILTTVLIVISVLVTSYIASYGLSEGIINFSVNGYEKLVSYFDTIISVTGKFGILILFTFIALSALTTLLGGYLVLINVANFNVKNNYLVYVGLLILGGALSVFNVELVFLLLEILLFISTSINIMALAMFTEFEWKKYKIRNLEIRKAA